MSKVIFWPGEDDAQIQIEVTGKHDDFTIKIAKAHVPAMNMWVDVTRFITESGRFDDHIAMVLREFCYGAAENYYFDLSKQRMEAQAGAT